MKVFDVEQLMQITMNDDDLAKEIVKIYIEETLENLQKLRSAIEDENAADARLHSHSIKGASANVGADIIQAKAAQAEMAAKSGDLNTVKDLIVTLEEAYRDFVTEATVTEY